MANSQMDESTLLSIIRAHRDDSLGVEDGDLTIQRAAALNHYHGRAYGDEVEGRSQVVSRDLAEAVDWCMPGIMRVFVQSGALGMFDPVGPEDEQLAQQESDYVNQVMMKDNPGFMILHDAIKDTLLLKNGYVKHFWDVTDKTSEEEYSGLTMDEVAMMMRQLEGQGSKVEIIGQESRFVAIPGMPNQNTAQQIMVPQELEVFDLRLKITRKEGKAVWLAVPSEEVRVSKKARGSLQDSPFTEHVTKKTRSDLIEMGMPQSFVYELPAYAERTNTNQSLARDSVTEESDTLGQAAGDRSMDELEFCEAYMRIDYDGDGVAELRKIVTVGNRIPPGEEWNEQIPAVPMTSFVAKRVPHRHVGESLDDELADLQQIMTVLKRQLLDNIYRINNAETVINEDANIRDFMTSIPGGLKRVKGSAPVQQAFATIVPAPIIGQLMPVIDYIEGSKESRTGISKATTGLDPDVLQQTTKGAYLENLNRASQKMEMIARMLAETGVKEAVMQMHALLIRHQDKPRMVQLRGKWVSVNPQEWRERTDLTVRVGLGTGSEEEKQRKLQMLTGAQSAVLQAVGTLPPPIYSRMYTLFADMAESMGFESPEKYAIPPGSPEHAQIWQAAQQARAQQAQQGQQSPDDLARAAAIQGQAQLQVQAAKNDANLRVKSAEDQFNRDKAQMQATFDAQNKDADRRLEMFLAQMDAMNKKQAEDRDRASREAIAAMNAEVQLLLKGVGRDLGAPGISTGVQGAIGEPLKEPGEQVNEAGNPAANAPAEGGAVPE
jgi:hypothetical protein